MLQPDIADFIYIRLHGDSELYVSGYSDALLNKWAEKIDKWRCSTGTSDAHGQPQADTRTRHTTATPTTDTKETVASTCTSSVQHQHKRSTPAPSRPSSSSCVLEHKPAHGHAAAATSLPSAAKDVYVYFDNDARSRAPYDAISLRQKLTGHQAVAAEQVMEQLGIKPRAAAAGRRVKRRVELKEEADEHLMGNNSTAAAVKVEVHQTATEARCIESQIKSEVDIVAKQSMCEHVSMAQTETVEGNVGTGVGRHKRGRHKAEQSDTKTTGDGEGAAVANATSRSRWPRKSKQMQS